MVIAAGKTSFSSNQRIDFENTGMVHKHGHSVHSHLFFLPIKQFPNHSFQHLRKEKKFRTFTWSAV